MCGNAGMKSKEKAENSSAVKGTKNAPEEIFVLAKCMKQLTE
jgi:hypothetical protein